jgi:hypothetical protein
MCVECTSDIQNKLDGLDGGSGDDSLSQSFFEDTQSDGFKDLVDCGPGNDEAWINTSVDHDVAVNCETVHEG